MQVKQEETILYEEMPDLSPEAFIDILQRSGLAARRPVHEFTRIAKMLSRANLIVVARERASGKLVGVSRSLTDFSYCCYLSDLAVDTTYQRRGIGKNLIAVTQQLAGPECSLILVSAPDAVEFYRHIGMPVTESAFVQRRTL